MSTGCPRPVDSSDSASLDSNDTIAVPKAAWERLLTMVEKLNENQAEFNKLQAMLMQQLERANARIQELEGAKLTNANRGETPQPEDSSKFPAPSMISPNGSSTTNVFKYKVTRPVEQSPKVSSPQRKSWADIAAAPRPQLSDVSASMQEKLRTSIALLDIQSPEPDPVALYFRNIKRTRLGHVRKALKTIFTHPRGSAWIVLHWTVRGGNCLSQRASTPNCGETPNTRSYSL